MFRKKKNLETILEINLEKNLEINLEKNLRQGGHALALDFMSSCCSLSLSSHHQGNFGTHAQLFRQLSFSKCSCSSRSLALVAPLLRNPVDLCSAIHRLRSEGSRRQASSSSCTSSASGSGTCCSVRPPRRVFAGACWPSPARRRRSE